MIKFKIFILSSIIILNACFISCSKKEINESEEDKIFQEIVKNPKNIGAYFNRIDFYTDNYQYQLALDDIDFILSLNTSDKEKSMCLSKKANIILYQNRGVVLNDETIKKDFLVNVNEAIKLNSDNAHAYRTLGYFYAMDSNLEKALTYVDKAIEIDKNTKEEYIKSLFTKACIYDIYAVKTKDVSFLQKALDSYLSIVDEFGKEKELKKQLKEVFFNIGNIYIKQEKYKLAIDNFTEVINFVDDTKIPLTIKSYFFRGLANYNNEEYDKALTDFEDCKALLEKNILLSDSLLSIFPSLNYFKALSYYHLGKYNDAIMNFNEYLQESKEDSFMLSKKNTLANIYAYRGASHSMLGSTEKAIVNLFYALQLNFSDENFILNELQKAERNSLIVSTGEVFPSHIVILKSNGKVVVFGDDSQGQCDVKDWEDIIAISANDYITVGVKKDGTCVSCGWNGLKNTGQKNVEGWKDIVAISAGGTHTIGLKKDGTVVAVGANDYGQCNVKGWKDIVAVAAGTAHTIGVKKDGTVVACGNNWKGQCNVQKWNDIVAVSASSEHTLGLKKDGTVVACGNNYYGQCDVQNWRDIIAISAGGRNSMGLTINGKLILCGDDSYYQCTKMKNAIKDGMTYNTIAISAGGVFHFVTLKEDDNGSYLLIGGFISKKENGETEKLSDKDFFKKYK